MLQMPDLQLVTTSSERWPAAEQPAFEADQFDQTLQTSALGRVLLTACSVTSTQQLVWDNRSHLPVGVSATADLSQYMCGACR